MMTIEKTILKNLISNEEYTRKILPFIKPDYFHDNTERVILDEIQSFLAKYNKLPTIESIKIELSNRPGFVAAEFKTAIELIDDISGNDEVSNQEWLLESTEKFCQEKALHNAILDSIHILDGSSKVHDKGAIPSLLTEALSVSFDPYIGHDYFDNAETRYEYYHRIEKKVPYDLEFLNKITRGGLSRKALACYLGGTGSGKSLVMCHNAAANLSSGYNVLYITLEMAEERIAERIDANLLRMKVDELEQMPRDTYLRKIRHMESSVKGKLIIKEYPTASAGVLHFRSLLNDLALKRGFFPDIVYVDYINICSSSRLKHGNNVNSYSYIKAIAEELRGLAVERDIAIVTATQTTRSGASNSDMGLEDVSESFGLPATVDMMLAIIRTEELDNMNMIMFKQLKNRFSDLTENKRFMVGIDRSMMRLYDVEQGQITDSGQEEKPKFDGYPSNKNVEDKYSKFKGLSV